MKYKNIVWDWNGTLLNDAEIGHATLCRMLEKRDLKSITLQEYKDWFGFPIKDFYEAIGFDFNRDDWHEVSMDFVNIYNSLAGGVALNEGVREVLESLRISGVKQYILSALQEDELRQMVVDFGIEECFEQVCGLDNIYANSKVKRGEEMLRLYPIIPEDTLMIGDTLHDAEVADSLGFDCVLFGGGHNSEQRLREKKRVIVQMADVLEM